MASSSQLGDGIRDSVSKIVSRTFPKSRVHCVSILEGGKTNSNLLIRIENYNDLLVLRSYRRGASVCRKEVALLQALQEVFPVPELIDADTAENMSGKAYMLYRYVPGQTFREMRESGSSQDMADSATAIGRCLSVLGSLNWSRLPGHILLPKDEAAEDDFNSPILRERVGYEGCLRLQKLYYKSLPVLQSLPENESLRHGDFNHRNVVLSKATGTWKVAGVLDWELASEGSFLWDAARFMCYERADSRFWEDAFVAGLRGPGVTIPGGWSDLSLTLNTLSAARSLARDDLQERFTRELKLLVWNGLRGKRTS